MRRTMTRLKTYIGIDNGVSGSIGVIDPYSHPYSKAYYRTPTIKQQDYTKSKKNITRIDGVDLKDILQLHIESGNCIAIVERPMVNPGRFQATASALRALEATLIVLESLNIPYQFCDSKEWQKDFLPSSGKKKADPKILKDESRDIGIRLFPGCREEIEKQKDADGLLIAEWARRNNL